MRNIQQKPTKPKRSLFQWGSELLAMTLAIILAILMVGPTYSASIDWFREYISSQYGESFVGLASVGWFIAMAIICFGFISLVFIIFINRIGMFFSSRR